MGMGMGMGLGGRWCDVIRPVMVGAVDLTNAAIQWR